jgi:transposase
MHAPQQDSLSSHKADPSRPDWTEGRISLTEAARRLHVSPSTCWRWAMQGVRGVKLETHVWGAKRYVNESALERFREACTAAANGEKSTPQSRTPNRRQRDIEAAERELDRAGI